MKIENIFENYIKLRSKLNNAKIYKITDNTNQNVYIGSTCNSLKNRLMQHKYDYKRFLNGLYHNIKSFDIIKNGDYKIELLENCNIKTKQELLAIERYYIENNECLNKNIPGNFDKGCQQYHKDYYIENIDKIKEYYNNNKDKIKKSQKDYYINNKRKLLDKANEYNAKNKDKLQQKFICQCGGNYTYANKQQHLKSNKHQNYLKSQNK